MKTDKECALKSKTTYSIEIQVRVEPHPFFERHNANLHCVVSVPLTQAVLGGKVDVETLSGSVSLKINSGTKDGDVYKIKGKGMPSLRGGRGDQYAHIKIDIPKKLSREQKKLFEQLRDQGI